MTVLTTFMPQPCQQQQGAGGVIIKQNALIATAATDPAITCSLPNDCAAKVVQIGGKPSAHWSDAEGEFMAAMILIARLWPKC